jgi:phage FluMu protein Com
MTDLNYLDGNAAAGVLSELFAVDMTTARGRCAHCGDVAVVARARMYPDDHGLVLRCSVCEDVLAMVVETPGRLCLDLRGLAWLEIAVDE